MASPENEDISKFPQLGQKLTWVDQPGNAMRIVKWLTVLCILLTLPDILEFFGLMHFKHPHFNMEEIPNFYGFYGFIMFSLLIIVAKSLRVIIGRKEDYYGDKAVDQEEYPADQLEKADHEC